jgi:hypothetical protein
MKITFQKCPKQYSMPQMIIITSIISFQKQKTSERRSTDADSRPITSVLKYHFFLPLICRFQGDHSVWELLSTRGGDPYDVTLGAVK